MDKFIQKLNFDFTTNQRVFSLSATWIALKANGMLLRSIHPFQDGNGRLSRLLTTLCMLLNDYTFIQYISFECQIEQNKKEYYEALMIGQKNRGTENERIDKWLLFFLESLNTLTQKRQIQQKKFITNHQPIKVSDLANQFTEIQLSTLKKDLQYLRDEQELTMIGKGKGRVYVINEKE